MLSAFHVIFISFIIKD